MSTSALSAESSSAAAPHVARRRRWWKWPVVLAALAAAFALDAHVAAWTRTAGLRPWLESRFFPTTDRVALVANLAAVGLSLRGWRPRRATLYAWAGFGFAFLVHLPVVHLLKWLIGRARPLADCGAFCFAPCTTARYFDSFPSAHTSAAATLALLLAHYFPRYRWVFYAWAALEGLKRIVLDWHFLSDVLAGWVLAWLIVSVCVRAVGPPWFPRGRRA